MHRVPEAQCLNCGKKLNSATLPDGDDAPLPGDYTMCIRCGNLMAFADDLTLRALTKEELLEVETDPGVAMMQQARRRLSQ